MSSRDRYLYRALRKLEIDSGYVLIPKSQGPFVRASKFGIDTTFPISLVPTEENAVRQHQWKQNGLPTSGISTTPHLERARFYAANGVIVRIDRHLLAQHGIKEYRIRDYLLKDPQNVAVPEDDEVILVKEDGGDFPREIIVHIIMLSPSATGRHEQSQACPWAS